MNQWDDQHNDEEAFRRLFATLPVVVPSDGFVQAAIDAAWQARARRRRLFSLAAAAAVGTIGTASLLAGSGALQWLLLAAAGGAADIVMAIIRGTTATTEAAALMMRGATVFARVATMPQSVAILITAEVLGAFALFMLHRLLRSQIRLRRPGPLCI